jgi:aerobic-type carbon monoxide dehydrogenase small subunit (CoxS/CutS family)
MSMLAKCGEYYCTYCMSVVDMLVTMMHEKKTPPAETDAQAQTKSLVLRCTQVSLSLIFASIR